MLMFLSANKHRSHYGYDKNHCGDWNFTLIDEMCVFSYESACSNQRAHRTLALLRIYNVKGSRGINKGGWLYQDYTNLYSCLQFYRGCFGRLRALSTNIS